MQGAYNRLMGRWIAAVALAVFGGCWEPTDDGGVGSYDSCSAGLIDTPTREPRWSEETAHLGIAGSVYYSSCDEPERQITVTVSNEATGFREVQTASNECVQIFPTTGATQRNYYYNEWVPLARGVNSIVVSAVSRCASLHVTCDPCVDPPPVPDAGPPPPDAAPPDGPAPCDFAVLEPADFESTTSESSAAVSGTIGATGEHVFWENHTLGQWSEIAYSAGETTWSGSVPLVATATNDVILSAWCSNGGRAVEARFVTQVPP